jgi:hypothetical protein
MGVKSQNEAFSLARSCRNVVTERVEVSPLDGTVDPNGRTSVGSAVGFIFTFIGIICAIEIQIWFKLGTFLLYFRLELKQEHSERHINQQDPQFSRPHKLTGVVFIDQGAHSIRYGIGRTEQILPPGDRVEARQSTGGFFIRCRSRSSIDGCHGRRPVVAADRWACTQVKSSQHLQ